MALLRTSPPPPCDEAVTHPREISRSVWRGGSEIQSAPLLNHAPISIQLCLCVRILCICLFPIVHPPSPEATVFKLCAPIFMVNTKKNQISDQNSAPTIMHPPAGEATSVQLRTGKHIRRGVRIAGLPPLPPPAPPEEVFTPQEVGRGCVGNYLMSLCRPH